MLYVTNQWKDHCVELGVLLELSETSGALSVAFLLMRAQWLVGSNSRKLNVEPKLQSGVEPFPNFQKGNECHTELQFWFNAELVGAQIDEPLCPHRREGNAQRPSSSRELQQPPRFAQ